ncbi:hypothetical protein ZIOFF_011472 [Zingiber officinale]|uniref:CCHC-type domain-containing protein n=1 Tax=Zingiber officinale TaxID=94328 RepID=A0A8J5HQL6_ZINOF|nr:hypothetical protein ZIOFF_011472 [Zingiber officinale]
MFFRTHPSIAKEMILNQLTKRKPLASLPWRRGPRDPAGGSSCSSAEPYAFRRAEWRGASSLEAEGIGGPPGCDTPIAWASPSRRRSAPSPPPPGSPCEFSNLGQEGRGKDGRDRERAAGDGVLKPPFCVVVPDGGNRGEEREKLKWQFLLRVTVDKTHDVAAREGGLAREYLRRHCESGLAKEDSQCRYEGGLETSLLAAMGFPFCFCRRLSEEKLAAVVRRRLLPEKAKVFRLFGREKSVHHVLGGGQGTLLPFDPTHFGILKKILAGILLGATAIWILFEFVCYHLLPLISHGLIISLLTLFLCRRHFAANTDSDDDGTMNMHRQRKAEISSALKALWFNFSGRMPTETLAIKFTGKNYATWEFQFWMFLKGKELWGHIDGSLMAPENAKDLGQWETKDARIISWLLGSIEAHMVNNLGPFNTAKEIWDYLKRIYHQDNTARRFQLELEIGNFSQGDLSIEQYYSRFLNLWDEYSNIIYSKVPKEALASIQAIHEVSKRDQFIMKLRSDFDVARAGLLNRNPVPSLDICLGELLREEQRLATQAVLGASLEKSTVINVAYAAQGRNRGKDQLQCYSCKEFGHIARNCSKKFCNYCKQHGHIIKECPTRPENRRTQAFQATIPNLNVIGHTSTVTGTNQSVLTPEMVQQMILTAFSTLTLQGQGMNISSSWIVDSGASNHMTGSPDLSYNVRQYNGSQNIQIANGSNLPITAIGDIGSSFSHVFISPGLSTNLIFIGQMVDNHCDVHFSRDGCIVQDQVSGQVIAKGHKVGRLFPLQFSVPRNLSFSSIVTANKADIWHKRLGHPNNVILSNLMKNGFLGDNIQSFKHLLPLACTTCKLGKSKVLPFSTHGGRAKTCFEIIHSDVWGITPHEYYFPQHVSPSGSILLPHFEDTSPSTDRFIPVEVVAVGMEEKEDSLDVDDNISLNVVEEETELPLLDVAACCHSSSTALVLTNEVAVPMGSPPHSVMVNLALLESVLGEETPMSHVAR